MELRETIGANIRERRKRRCWSQEHLACAAGVNVRTVQRAEEGRGISMETILAVAAALDVSVTELQSEREDDGPRTARSSELKATNVAPIGNVALVFTDVQGATAIWERNPIVMRRSMLVHNTLIRRLIERNGGYETRSDGHSFMIAFGSPVQAVEFCLSAQHELLDAEWPPELLAHPEAAEIRTPTGGAIFRGLRVKMGVHAGDVDCENDTVTGRTDYFGRVVNCASRLLQAAHGGQVLATREAWSMAEHLVDAEGEDLGEVTLQGIPSPIALIQVHPPTKERRSFPAVACTGTTNLTPARTSFIGRKAEIALVSEWLRGDKRLVTILGPGGAGKTRLGRAVGASLATHFAGGAWLIELALARNLSTVLDLVAGQFGLELAAGDGIESSVKGVGSILKARGPALLIFDNAEHLVGDIASTIKHCLKVAPELRILVTTQHQLAIDGEQVYPIAGLAEAEAQQLFNERARQLCPALTLGESGNVLVAEIVDRLERLPLAIELAAARVKVLSLSEIRDRLAARLSFLQSGFSSDLARHSTMRATVEWSFSLLKPWEQRAIVDLARLPGSFDVATAEAILCLDGFDEATSALDVVQSLLEKSLIWASDSRESADETRLHMFESIRAFALEKPSEVAPRLVAWAVERGERLVAQANVARTAQNTKRLALDLKNYAEALEIAIGSNPDAALRIYDIIQVAASSRAEGFTLSLDLRERLWNAAMVSPDLERRALCRRMGRKFGLRRDPWDPKLAERDIARMEALGGIHFKAQYFRSIFAQHCGDFEAAWAYGVKAVEESALQNASEHCWSLLNVIGLAMNSELHPPEVAREYLDELFHLIARVPVAHVDALQLLTAFELKQGNLSAALQAHGQCYRVAHAQGRGPVGLVLGAAGLLYQLGKFDDALSEAEKERDYLELIGEIYHLVGIWELQGSIHCALGNDELARRCWEQGVELAGSNPVWRFRSEVCLLLLDLLQNVNSDIRLHALGNQLRAARPDIVRLVGALKGFVAAASGEPEKAITAVRVANQGTGWNGNTAWNALASALVDVAHAKKSKDKNELVECQAACAVAKEKLEAAPTTGAVALLRRLVGCAVEACM